MEFKDKLKEIRTANKLSQQALADAIHISRSAIAKWENGLGSPSADAKEALTAYFGTSPDFFGSDENESVVITTPTHKPNPGATILRKFCACFTIVVGSILLLFGCFVLLTQWKCITVPVEGISVRNMYRFPDGRIYYQLYNIPDGIWCYSWDFKVTEDGCRYMIPKRAIIELQKDTQPNQLEMDQLLDPNEQNAVNEKAGLPQITKWYLGKPGDAILIYTDGMEVPEATAKLVQKYYGTSNIFECLNKLIQQP